MAGQFKERRRSFDSFFSHALCLCPTFTRLVFTKLKILSQDRRLIEIPESLGEEVAKLEKVVSRMEESVNKMRCLAEEMEALKQLRVDAQVLLVEWIILFYVRFNFTFDIWKEVRLRQKS